MRKKRMLKIKRDQLGRAVQIILRVGRAHGDLSLVMDATRAGDPAWKPELIRRVRLHDEAAAKTLQSLKW
jgi:hypothetical protein